MSDLERSLAKTAPLDEQLRALEEIAKTKAISFAGQVAPLLGYPPTAAAAQATLEALMPDPAAWSGLLLFLPDHPAAGREFLDALYQHDLNALEVVNQWPLLGEPIWREIEQLMAEPGSARALAGWSFLAARREAPQRVFTIVLLALGGSLDGLSSLGVARPDALLALAHVVADAPGLVSAEQRERLLEWATALDAETAKRAYQLDRLARIALSLARTVGPGERADELLAMVLRRARAL